MAQNRRRFWSLIHTWTSLLCTVFILVSCITGLPLLFKAEIDDLLYDSVAPRAAEPGAAQANLDVIVANGMSHAIGETLRFLIWDRDEPNVIVLGVAKSGEPFNSNRIIRVDAHTGDFLDAPIVTDRITNLLLRLHTELLAGLPGKIILGVMGLLFVVAIVSGCALYVPSMRKLDFGTIRFQRRPAVRWLDIHNLIGVVTVMWALVVGGTGVVNSWGDLIIRTWENGQLRSMLAAVSTSLPTEKPVVIQRVAEAAINELPAMRPAFIAYPGTPYAGPSHFMVFMRGSTPATTRLLQPVLIDANSGIVAATSPLPWYVTSLLLSQPLHFGDYGGTTLRIVWAFLDVATIFVLVSGIYIWFVKRRKRKSDPVASFTGNTKPHSKKESRRTPFNVLKLPGVIAALTAWGLTISLFGDGATDLFGALCVSSGGLAALIWALGDRLKGKGRRSQ